MCSNISFIFAILCHFNLNIISVKKLKIKLILLYIDIKFVKVATHTTAGLTSMHEQYFCTSKL